MCGINGIFAYDDASEAICRAELLQSRDHMIARGPDGCGTWVSDDCRIGFGHRRLSIIELSEAGAQPMLSDDRAYVVTFNGEIYNFPGLRNNLEQRGHRFRGRSDTEVLLHLYAEKGEAMVRDLRGMFAFAIWDTRRQQLFLARDPFGIKPLYYGDDGKTFRFASQVKALIAGGRVPTTPDPAGVVGFHLWGSIPDPFTLYRGVCALPAGHTLSIPIGGPAGRPQPYVSLAAELAQGARARKAIDTETTFSIVRDAVHDSVRAHLLADVDVGLFLSAGVDSGALLGLMADAGATRVHTITLGFDDFVGSHDDEVPLAETVAQHYGARHTVRRVGHAEFEEDLPAVLAAMDQPSIDGVNTWFVSKAAREAGLKVALSGLGGDEVLAGYPGFEQIPRMARTFGPLQKLPIAGKAVRRLAAGVGLTRWRPKLAGLAEYGGSLEGAYLLRRGLFLPYDLEQVLEPEIIADGLRRLAPLALLRECLEPDPDSDIGRVAALECGAYTRNQLLRDADWAGMAHSLEIRTPLMDINLLRSLSPVIPGLGGRVGKNALAASPRRALPQTVVNRAKSGFAVPTGAWLAEAARARAGAGGSAVAPATKGLASRAWAQVVFAAHGSSTGAVPVRAETKAQANINANTVAPSATS